MIHKPTSVDMLKYQPDGNKKEVFYGLPEKVVFCKKCTYSNQKPNSEKESTHTAKSKKPTVAFDSDGVCFACNVAEEKNQIDWASRRKELEEICSKYRNYSYRI